MKALKTMIIFFIMYSCLSGAPARSEPGLTETEIRLGTHLALTGPAAILGQPIADGMQLYIKHINDQGGLFNKKLVLFVEDDNFLPARAKQAVKKLVHKEKVFLLLGPVHGAGVMAALPDIMKNKIPVLFVNSALDALFYPPKRYLFGWLVPYSVATGIQVDMAVNRLGKKRIALINQWGPIGEANIKGARERLKKYGLDLVFEEKLKNIKTDYSGLVSKMRAKNIDGVIITTTAQWTMPLLKEIERQGWDVGVVLGHASGDISLLNKLAGTAAEGAIVTMSFPPANTDDPHMNEYRQILKKYHGETQPRYYHHIGYALMKMCVSTLKQIGPDLTREKLIDRLETWKNHETGWIGKVSYSPTDHIGAEGLVIVKMTGGEAKVLIPRYYLAPVPKCPSAAFQ